MTTPDTLKPDDQVTVAIYDSNNMRLYQASGEGFHNLRQALEQAISHINHDINPEDCTFEVTNHRTGVVHRYRLNAHGNIKLIV